MSNSDTCPSKLIATLSLPDLHWLYLLRTRRTQNHSSTVQQAGGKSLLWQQLLKYQAELNLLAVNNC